MLPGAEMVHLGREELDVWLGEPDDFVLAVLRDIYDQEEDVMRWLNTPHVELGGRIRRGPSLGWPSNGSGIRPRRPMERAMNDTTLPASLATLLSELVRRYAADRRLHAEPRRQGIAGVARQAHAPTRHRRLSTTVRRSPRTSITSLYGITLMNRWAAGEKIPWRDADWKASWTRTTVDDAGWSDLRQRLANALQAWLITIGKPKEYSERELSRRSAASCISPITSARSGRWTARSAVRRRTTTWTRLLHPRTALDDHAHIAHHGHEENGNGMRDSPSVGNPVLR